MSRFGLHAILDGSAAGLDLLGLFTTSPGGVGYACLLEQSGGGFISLHITRLDSSRPPTDLGLVQGVFDLGSGNILGQSTLIGSFHLAVRARARAVRVFSIIAHGRSRHADRLCAKDAFKTSDQTHLDLDSSDFSSDGLNVPRPASSCPERSCWRSRTRECPRPFDPQRAR